MRFVVTAATSIASLFGIRTVVFAPKREWCRATAIALSVPVGFLICVAMFVAAAIQVGRVGNLQIASQVVFIILALYHILPFFFTSYEITDSELRLRIQLHLMKIPLKDIYTIEPSRGELGMPAWSNHSLKIRYHRNRVVGDYVVISPLDETAFLAELERRAPGLQPAIIGKQRPAAAL